MKPDWISRGRVVASVDGGGIDIGSERMLNGDPDSASYPGSVEAWHDGTRLTDEEQTQLLDGTVVERGENHVRSHHDL